MPGARPRWPAVLDQLTINWGFQWLQFIVKPYKLRVSGLILSWLKSSFRFFLKMLWKNPIELFGQLDFSRWTFLVAQWIRTHLPMQMRCAFNRWSEKIPHALEQLSPCATATEPVLWSPLATQLLKPKCLEPMLCNKKSHHNEKPAHCKKDAVQPKI